MNKKIIIYILGFLLISQSLIAQEDFRKTAPKPGVAPRIELGKAKQFTLKNGLKVIIVENHKLPRIAIQVFVDVPPFMEGDAAGYASIAGQLLSKGTKTRTKAQIDEEVDFVGATLSTSSSGVIGAALTKHQDKLLEMISDVLLNPTFPEEEFDKIKKQTLSGLAQSKDNPNAIAANVQTVLRYGKNHPYGEIQTEESIENITLDKCRSFYESNFKPNISYLIVTGDVSAKKFKKQAKQYFGKWKSGKVVKQNYLKPEKPKGASVAFVDKAGAVQSVIAVTYPVDLHPASPDVLKAQVMNTILGGYFSSRLNANLREDKGYTYGATSGLSQDQLVGNFTASASVRNAVTDSSLTQFIFEMNKMREQEVSDEELEMVKNYLTGSFARSLENPGTVARFTLNVARYNLPSNYYATYLERLSLVSKKDILEMARKYITPDNAYLLVVGNKDNVADKLRNFAATGEVKFYDVYGNPVKVIEEAVPTDLTAEQVINNYLNALAPPSELAKINNVKIEMATEVQGMTIETTLQHKAPNKLLMVNKMMGNEVQRMVFDGEKGFQVQMGQTIPLQDNEHQDMIVDGQLFPERKYKENGVKVSLSGMDIVNGKKAYKVLVTYPSGTKKTHFFDVESFLKIKEIETEGAATVTNDIGDYKKVNGVMFPHSVTITGAAPFPLKMITKSIIVNGEMKDEIFK